MSTDPKPVIAFDVAADGTVTLAENLDTSPAPGAAFRWLHFNLHTDGLENWCKTNLPPLACRTLLAERTRPRVDVQADGVVLTLRGINLNEGEELQDMVSIRIWATQTLMVTVRRVRVFALDEMQMQILAGDPPDTTARLIARITEKLLDGVETLSLELEARTDAIEAAIYVNDQPSPEEVAPLRRQMITLRRHIGPMADALSDLAHLDTPVIPPDFRNRLRYTASRARRSVDEVHEVADRLTALNDHVELRQDARLTRNSYVLSVIAAIFIPLSFLTGLFGVNVAGMPGTDNPQSFAILCGSMVGLGVLLYLFLRWIKWF